MLISVLTLLGGAPAAQGRARVVSLDQCADQYVLALAPRIEIVALSKRARQADSFTRASAAGLPLRRADSETVLAERPTLVVRYWGGDSALLRDLHARGVAVADIDDAATFAGVETNVRRVAAALGRPAAGEALIGRMRGELARASGAWRGQEALYLTSAGFTAGPDTLVGAMLAAAGLKDLSRRPGYQPVPLEALALSPPAVLVEGFFGGGWAATQYWSPMRNPVIGGLARSRPMVRLPGSILGCPAWFAADGAAVLARAAPRA
ncbi:MAG TPA: ABC transporter substrate-binding protein [Caulobacteraceae bacterium]|nr:ABC transporter substrate-binding protein [Caulobacteraceae bacterium]